MFTTQGKLEDMQSEVWRGVWGTLSFQEEVHG